MRKKISSFPNKTELCWHYCCSIKVQNKVFKCFQNKEELVVTNCATEISHKNGYFQISSLKTNFEGITEKVS